VSKERFTVSQEGPSERQILKKKGRFFEKFEEDAPKKAPQEQNLQYGSI